MTTTLQDLREKRANVWDSMKKLIEHEDDWSGEERASYAAAEKELDELGEKIETRERHEARAAKLDAVDRRGVVPPRGGDAGEPDADEETARRYSEAFGAFMRRGIADVTSEQRQLLQQRFVSGEELRAAGVATGSAGGYTVPPAFRNRIVEQMQYVAAMRQYAEVITTDTGATLPWPTVDDTGNEGAILGENTQVTEQDVTFGTNDLGAYMYTSKLVRVSFQLLNDSAFNLEQWLGRTLGNRIGRVQNRHFTVGTGSGQPDGLVTGAPVAKQGATGQVTTVTYDDLVDVQDGVDIAYAINQNWMMSQSARKVVRKIKDADGRPIWEPSIKAGTPDQLLGAGMVINNHVPAPAASAKSIVFGDIATSYVIRDVSDLQVLRLQERYADFLQVGFVAFQRSDGTVQNSAAIRAYQHAAS
ncbi:phage major capsid protein [Klenkia sp. LSe6-5]|uniref:Phage major capsid protein n=1 Tax=Klenkia sesuvii TaxID=3103137 RepID=A0ABU8DYL7_9ACTN